MTDHTVKVSVDDDIASIILDRGEVRNALNRDTMAQLRDAALAVSDSLLVLVASARNGLSC